MPVETTDRETGGKEFRKELEPLLRRLSLEQLYLAISAWNPNILDPTKVLHCSNSPVLELPLSWLQISDERGVIGVVMFSDISRLDLGWISPLNGEFGAQLGDGGVVSAEGKDLTNN